MTTRSSGGFDPRRPPVAIHSQCGEPVRLEADGWGYCRRCQVEWEASQLEIEAGGTRR